MTAERIWPGPDTAEAVAAYTRAIKAGFSHLRALVFAGFASFKDCWMLQSSLATFFHCSVRTVQRAAHDAREIGELRTAFGKPGEIPPGADGPMPFKWVHRFIPGRGFAAAAREAAINKARAAWTITKSGLRRTFNAPAPKVRTKPRIPPRHLDLEQSAQWITEQAAIEPSTSEVLQREPEPPDR